MSEPGPELSVDAQAEAAARALGGQAVGRTLTADEAAAMATIFKAAVQALRHGFITRLAERVVAEREDEAVEELLEDIRPD